MASSDDIVTKITITTEGADKAAEAYKSVATAADEASKQIQKAGEGGGDGFAKAGEAAAKAVEQLGKLGEAGGKAGELLSKISDAGNIASQGLDKIGGAVNSANKSLGAISDNSKAASAALDSVTSAINTAAQKASGFGPVGATVASALTTISGATAGTSQSIGALTTVLGTTQTAFTQFGTAINQLGPALSNLGTEARNAITTLTNLGSVSGGLPGKFAAISSAIGNVANAFGPVGVAVNVAIQAFNLLTPAVESAQAALAKKFELNADLSFLQKLNADAVIFGSTMRGLSVDEIKAQLEAMGLAGKKAFDDTGDAADAAGNKVVGFKSKIDNLSEIIGQEKKLGYDTSDAEKKLEDFKKRAETPITVTINGQQVTGTFDELTDKANKLKTLIEEQKKANVDFSQAQKDLDAVNKAIADFNNPIKIKAVADVSDAKAKVDELFRQKDITVALKGDPTDIDAKLAAAVIKYNEFKAKLETPITPKVTAPTGGASITNFIENIKSDWDRVKEIFGKAFDMSAHADEFDQSLNKMVAEAGKTGQQINDALKIKPLEDPSGAGQFSNLVQAAEKAANEVEAVFNNIKPEFSGGLDFSGVVDAARSAANDVEAVFNDIKPEFSGGLDFSGVVDAARSAANDVEAVFNDIKPEFSGGLDFTSVIDAARSAANEIEAIFGNIRPEFSGGLDFSGVVDAARSAANEIEAVFQSIKLEFSGSIDFGAIINAAQEAAQQIEQIFAGMNLSGVRPELDFSGAEQASQDAVDKIQQIFDKLNQIDFSGLIDALSNAAQTAAGNVSFEMGNIDFSGLISQIDNVIQAFNDMADAAANAAAESANATAQGAGGFALGGLFRGRPGTDSNLALLSDYEFVMRPEAVQHYGVDFMRLVNAMQLPMRGFGSGGLVSALSATFAMPRMTLPAFAGGGLNITSSSGGGASQAMRPFTLNIDSKSFGGLLAPVSVGKALEREAIAQQASSTGIRPRWVK